MAEIYKFFNSAPGDERWYFASDFADYFGNVLSSGLLHKDGTPNLQVKVVEGELKTRVDVGEALMQGYQYENTLPLTLEHGLPEPNLDRIDRIVLRLDKRNDARYIKLFVKQGESAVNPSPPQLQRDNYVHELSLAQVRVRKNTSSLNVADVKDERMIEDLCGIVYSLISVPTTVFQQQFDTWLADYKITNTTAWEAWQNQEKADFEAWFDSVKDILDGDVATKLAAQIAIVDDKIDQHIAQDNAHGIGDKTTLATPDKTTIVGAINSHVHDYIKHPAYAVTTGTNAYSVTLNPKPTKLEEGMGIVMKVGTNATANCTLNVNGMGAKPIMSPDGIPINDLKSGGVYTVRYNGTNFILQGEGGKAKFERVNSRLLSLGIKPKNDVYQAARSSNDDFLYTSSQIFSSSFPGRVRKYDKRTGLLVKSNIYETSSVGGTRILTYCNDKVYMANRQEHGHHILIYDDNKNLLNKIPYNIEYMEAVQQGRTEDELAVVINGGLGIYTLSMVFLKGVFSGEGYFFELVTFYGKTKTEAAVLRSKGSTDFYFTDTKGFSTTSSNETTEDDLDYRSLSISWAQSYITGK